MGRLKILKASAGSGKTHDLTQQYIDFVLPPDESPFDEFAFRHILAVTFTNKATEEMKSRIVEELYSLSKSDKVTAIRRERAGKVLTAILHDYSSFAVSTIDKFFQMVMRAFAREINQYASYKVELDSGAVLRQTVDRMMASLDDPDNSSLLQWLTEYSLERIEAGQKWDISDELNRMASLFMREDFKLKRRRRGINWDKEKMRSLFGQLTDDQRQNLYLLGIFSDLFDNLQSYLAENNLVLLGETADVLNRIIDGSDTPFIYEKIGTRFDHFMLDEFQDTSRLQWENFRPLIAESLDKGADSLIVGDIKQSIYRWRNSDLNLLDSDIYKNFRNDQFSTRPKQDNWRSYGNIIDFNNDFFSKIDTFVDVNDDPQGRVKRYYNDARQMLPDLRRGFAGKGCVQVHFLPRQDNNGDSIQWRERALERLEGDVALLLKENRPCDIAVLVRKNREGEAVARKLLSLGYEVITEDSLMLRSSVALRKTMALLKFLTVPEDSVNNLTIKLLFQREKPDIEGLDIHGSLYDLCDSILREKIAPLPEGETPFVFAFLDEVLNYMDKFGSNLRGFVEWWEESGSAKCISVPQSDGAIRVMTIHKAKGLSSKAVILPFFNEPLHSSSKEIYIWCEPDEEPFREISPVPVKYTKEIKNTIFAADYQEENLMQIVDNVNTAYVAMTRAVCNMLIYAPQPKRTSKGEIHKGNIGVSDWLYLHLEKELVEDADGEKVWSVGKICGDRAKREETSETNYICPDFLSCKYDERLKLKLRGADYFDREQGIKYHDILSRIEDESQLEGALASALSDGLISEDDLPLARNAILRVFAHCAPLHWFDGTWRSLNECSIADDGGNLSRPDRVLVEKDKPLGSGEAIVIDYKFGEKRFSYKKQVKEYMELLRKMGYSKVSGALLYCKDEIEIENV